MLAGPAYVSVFLRNFCRFIELHPRVRSRLLWHVPSHRWSSALAKWSRVRLDFFQGSGKVWNEQDPWVFWRVCADHHPHSR